MAYKESAEAKNELARKFLLKAETDPNKQQDFLQPASSWDYLRYKWLRSSQAQFQGSKALLLLDNAESILDTHDHVRALST